MATLTIQLPGLPPVSHLLKDETITIGRMKGNTIVIEDASISLMHARITRRNGAFFLKDLNSTNGTEVNGQPVTEASLQDHDHVRFADISGQFHAEETAAAATPPASPFIAERIPPAPPSSRPAQPVTPARRPSPALAFVRLLTRLAPYAGGFAALVVVFFVGWKLLHPDAADSGKTTGPAATGSLAPIASGLPDLQLQNVTSQTATAYNPGPRTNAVAASADENVSRLVKALRDEDPAERRRAATALHSVGAEAKDAIAALREALNDPDEEVQMWSALTLVNNQSYDKTTIPILVRGLRHENSALRQVACLSLAIIPYEDPEKDLVVPALAETAGKDVEEAVRKAAISALNIIAPEIIVKANER